MRTLLLILFLFCLQTSRAQNYTPFIDSNSFWYVVSMNAFPVSYYFYGYSFSGLDTIDSTEYAIVNNGEFLVREDSQRVYLHRDTGEYLLYDFNLQVGDSFLLPCYDTILCLTPLSDIDTVTIGGIDRKRFRFIDETRWIEGLGDVTTGPFYPFLYSYFETGVWLDCYYYEGQSIYGECYPWSIDEVASSTEVLLYPTISDGLIQVQSSSIISHISILNMQGELVRRESYPQGIDASSLASGMYLANIHLQNGDLKTLRFYRL